MKKYWSIALFAIIFHANISFADTHTMTTVTSGPLMQPTPVNTSSATSITTTTSDTPLSTPFDDNIVSSVYDKYHKTPALIGTNLTVSSVNRIVTINGKVTAQSQADAAVESAKSVVGVKDVRSKIEVTTNPDLNKPTTSANSPNY